MVYDSQTLELLHNATEECKLRHQKIVEEKMHKIQQINESCFLVRWFNYIINSN